MKSRIMEAKNTGLLPQILAAAELASPAAAESMSGTPVRAATAVYETEYRLAKSSFTLINAVFITLQMATVVSRAYKLSSFLRLDQLYTASVR